MDAILMFLDRFYRSDQLHKITKLTLTPKKTSRDEVTASIDIEAVGVWGHGVGGGAAFQVCLTDERCDAVAGFDPLVSALTNPVLATTATATPPRFWRVLS